MFPWVKTMSDAPREISVGVNFGENFRNLGVLFVRNVVFCDLIFGSFLEKSNGPWNRDPSCSAIFQIQLLTSRKWHFCCINLSVLYNKIVRKTRIAKMTDIYKKSKYIQHQPPKNGFQLSTYLFSPLQLSGIFVHQRSGTVFWGQRFGQFDREADGRSALAIERWGEKKHRRVGLVVVLFFFFHQEKVCFFFPSFFFLKGGFKETEVFFFQEML